METSGTRSILIMRVPLLAAVITVVSHPRSQGHDGASSARVMRDGAAAEMKHKDRSATGPEGVQEVQSPEIEGMRRVAAAQEGRLA